jgi:hypothetical protein
MEKIGKKKIGKEKFLGGVNRHPRKQHKGVGVLKRGLTHRESSY